MSERSRTPRQLRARFQRLPLPTWLRISVLTVGWLMVLLGIVGLFLPILQGGLTLALGLALLSIASQTMHLWFRSVMGRWPKIWKRLERLRRKLHFRLHKASGGDRRATPAGAPTSAKSADSAETAD
jgi:hypothetical protein